MKKGDKKLDIISFGKGNPNAIIDRITKERADAGWIWVQFGKTKKQIHPDKWEAHKQNGWKRLTKKS